MLRQVVLALPHQGHGDLAHGLGLVQLGTAPPVENKQRQEAGHDGGALGVLNDLGEGQGSVTAQPAGDEARCSPTGTRSCR